MNVKEQTECLLEQLNVISLISNFLIIYLQTKAKYVEQIEKDISMTKADESLICTNGIRHIRLFVFYPYFQKVWFFLRKTFAHKRDLPEAIKWYRNGKLTLTVHWQHSKCYYLPHTVYMISHEKHSTQTVAYYTTQHTIHWNDIVHVPLQFYILNVSLVFTSWHWRWCNRLMNPKQPEILFHAIQKKKKGTYEILHFSLVLNKYRLSFLFSILFRFFFVLASYAGEFYVHIVNTNHQQQSTSYCFLFIFQMKWNSNSCTWYAQWGALKCYQLSHYHSMHVNQIKKIFT